MNTTSFSIESQICPTTNKPYGTRYAGTFSIRRPSIRDRINADLRNSATLSAAGEVNPDMLNGSTKLNSFIFAFVQTIAEQPLPEWFDMDSMYDDTDVDAVMSVWQEVGKFLDSFRPKASGEDSQQGSDQPSLLVQK